MRIKVERAIIGAIKVERDIIGAIKVEWENQSRMGYY